MKYAQLLGEFLGYPDCCIQAFLKRDKKPTSFKLRGTGYIPCEECNKLDEKTLIERIQSKRKCPVPFPKARRIKDVL